MFDIASSKLLILGLVALLVIGPKDLPALLRTLGKYMGMIRRHANDFRAQFEEAMRDSELAELKKQVQTVGEETQAAMREAETTIGKHLDDARAGVDPQQVLGDPFAPPAVEPTASTAPAAPEVPPVPAAVPPPATPDAPPDAVRTAEKTGA